MLLCFSLIACGESVDRPPDDSECTSHTDKNNDNKCDTCDTAIQPVADGAVELVKGGSAQFQIVTDAEASINNYNNVIAALNKINLRLSGEKATAVPEANSTEQTYEILVGSVASRGEEYTFDKHDYGAKGYIIKIVGTKVCVVAGSDEALNDALDELLGEFFGIKNNKVRPIDNLVVTAENNIDKTQTGYSISELKVDGKRINDFAITVNSDGILETAKIMQNSLYVNTGVWLDIIDESEITDGQGAVRLNLIENGGEGTTDAGFHVYVADGDLIIDCEFVNKIESAINEFLSSAIFDAGKSEIDFTDGTVQTQNVRDIYYSEFGAKGDGVTDDFAAIKAAHECANLYGHRIHADADKVYYIGNENGTSSIIIKTDTYWHGCKFIFDDSEVSQDDYDERSAPIFHIASDYETATYSESTLPISSLEKGAENVGFAPGFKALIIVYTSNVRHYIRYGSSQTDSSNYQHEIIMVDENGNIAPSTPVQWDYETVTQIDVIRADDKPITVSGGSRENRALIETIFNGAPLNNYTYYWRNIYITRSNVTLENIEHVITNDIPESEGGTGAPYCGFTYVDTCANIIIQGMTFQRPESRRLYNDFYNIMGSYEMDAIYVHNLTYRDCDQSNFYNEDGSINSYGIMGTNYCKNLTFDRMTVSSFNASRGTYNATIKNSTLQYIELIGDGIVTIENVTAYTGISMRSVISLRPDYGSTWWGDIYIDGLNIKCDSSFGADYIIALIGASWVNYNFGFDASLPQSITMKNVNLYEYEYGIDDSGNRRESIVSTNERKIYIYSQSIGQSKYDYSDPETTIYDNNIHNVISPTKSITVINSDVENLLNIVWMTSPTFQNTKITVDGEEINKQGENQ